MFDFFNNFWIGIRPFLIGTLLAYLLTVPCGKLYVCFSKRLSTKLSNFLSVLFVELGFCILIILFLLLVVPQCASSVYTIISNLSGYLDACQFQIDKLVANYKILSDVGLQDFDIYSQLSNFVVDNITANTTQLLNTIYTKTYSFGTVLMDIFVSLVASFFILLDRDNAYIRFQKVIKSIFPTFHVFIMKCIEKVNVTFRQFVVGKTIDSLIIGVLCFFVFCLFKIPFVLTISVFICITNMIPIIGPIVGAIPGMIIIFSESPMKAFQFAILVLIIQQIDGNVIGPKCIGYSIGLNTFWVLFSVLVFGKLFGFLGMFFGVPVFAVIYDGFNFWVDSHQTKDSHVFLNKIKTVLKLDK